MALIACWRDVRQSEREMSAARGSTEEVGDGRRPMARLCRLHLWADFAGYGFNLVAMKGRRASHYVQNVERGSPAEAGGLAVGDRVLEVNGSSVSSDSHQQVRVTAAALSLYSVILLPYSVRNAN